MSDRRDELNVLAPRELRSKFDYLHREVQRAAGVRISRRQALGLGGLALLAAACGTTTTTSQNTTSSAPTTGASSANPLTGKSLEDHLEIYNWSQYDDPSTYKGFKALPDETAAGLSIHETYYSSNDELLAKLHAGGASYDIVVPSQNAVAQLIEEGKLLAMDQDLLPNLSNLDPTYLKPSYDPTGQYHVIKDFGITMFFYNNQIVTEQPQTMHDFYMLLTKYVSKGRTNLLDGAEEVVPLALMSLGLDPNTDSQSDFDQATSFLLSIRKGVTTVSSYGYINDASAGKIILSQGWNGDVRRIVQARKAQGDITAIIPTEASEIWADNWCILASAPHPVAAHAWINWLLTPSTAITEMNYHNYPIPMPAALSQLSPDLRDDPMFNVPSQYTDNYHYILNVSPDVVQARTRIYTEFKAAG
jgi:spermidine/putrescine transport system substrate-binding protein